MHRQGLPSWKCPRSSLRTPRDTALWSWLGKYFVGILGHRKSREWWFDVADGFTVLPKSDMKLWFQQKESTVLCDSQKNLEGTRRVTLDALKLVGWNIVEPPSIAWTNLSCSNSTEMYRALNFLIGFLERTSGKVHMESFPISSRHHRSTELVWSYRLIMI